MWASAAAFFCESRKDFSVTKKGRKKRERSERAPAGDVASRASADPLYRLGRRGRSLLLVLVLLLAAWVRFGRLDLAEFKGDQAANHRLVLQTLAGHPPAVGIMSSRGVENFALFIYVLAIPAIINSSPLFLTGVVAAFGVAAVYVAYRLGAACFGKTVGMTAAGLFAASPWAVLFSRSIWTQNLLAPFVASLFFFLVKMRRKPRPWHPAVVLALFAVVIQLHFSAFALFLVLPFAVRWGWKKQLRRGWLAGAVIALCLVLPYVIHDASQGFADVRSMFTAAGGRGPGIPGDGYRPWEIRQAADLMSVRGFDYVLGYTFYQRQVAAWPFQAVPWMCTVLALGGCVILVSKLPRDGAARVLGLWIAAVALVMPIFRVNPAYYIVTFPAQFILAGLAVRWMMGLGARFKRDERSAIRLVALAVVVACAAVNISFWHNVMTFVENVGSTQEDYGVPYRYKREVAELIGRLGGGETYHFVDKSADHDNAQSYAYLAKLSGSESAHVPLDAKPARIFVLAFDIMREKSIDMNDFRALGVRGVMTAIVKWTDAPELSAYRAESTHRIAGGLTLCVLKRKAREGISSRPSAAANWKVDITALSNTF